MENHPNNTLPAMNAIIAEVKTVLEISRGNIARQVNSELLSAYWNIGRIGIEGREAFAYEGKEYLQTHHLYVCPADSTELKRHLAFRDYLRSHPDAKEKYANVKLEAAKRYPDDIDKYIEYKSPVIEEIYVAMSSNK